MSTKQFDQQQKLTIVEHGQKIGFKAAAKVAGVHYTSVYITLDARNRVLN